MPRSIRENDFLRLKFQEYYLKNPDGVDLPYKVHMREFAFERWDYPWRCPVRTEHIPNGGETTSGCGRSGLSSIQVKKCPFCGTPLSDSSKWVRPIGFRTRNALIKDLQVRTPHSVYHSAAFYGYPVARNMDEKEWQSAELVFDIDADHLGLACSEEHDAWKCNTPHCDEAGTGNSPSDGCPKCGNESFSTRKWICDSCLEDAKQNTLKIFDEFLVQDLGIPPETIQLNYSGHRGYHLRVRDSKVYRLDQDARMEIIHHITGLGFSSDKYVVQRGPATVIPDRMALGWAGKTADAIAKFVRDIDAYDGLERWVEALRKRKDAALKGLASNPPLLSSRVSGVGTKSWQEIASKAVLLYGGEIDVPVTHDLHRVIRLIGSINGKTGFTVTSLTRDETNSFNPFKDALAFGEGEMKVSILGGLVKVPRFRIGEEFYGPYGDEKVEIPIDVAVFLLCKGVAGIE